MGNTAADSLFKRALTNAKAPAVAAKVATADKEKEIAQRTAENQKRADEFNANKLKRQQEAQYQASVNANLDPVADDYRNLAQDARIQSNIDPAFRNYQLGLAQQLQAQASGQGPSVAQLQLQQATDRTLNQSLGQIRAATGANAGLSARTAALAGAQQLGSAGNASGLLRLQEQQQAQQQLAALSGQGRAGDLQADDNAMQAQIQTGNFKLGALNGLAGIRTTQANPSADIYGSNATDNRQIVGIQAQKDMASIQQAEDRAMARRASREKQNDRIWGAGTAILGAGLGAAMSGK